MTEENENITPSGRQQFAKRTSAWMALEYPYLPMHIIQSAVDAACAVVDSFVADQRNENEDGALLYGNVWDV